MTEPRRLQTHGADARRGTSGQADAEVCVASAACPPRGRPCWRGRGVVALAALMLLLAGLPLATAGADAPCSFVLGFADVREQLGADMVGDCLENEHVEPDLGVTEQATTQGMLVWQPASNVTAFITADHVLAFGTDGLVDCAPAASDCPLQGFTLTPAAAAPPPTATAEMPAPTTVAQSATTVPGPPATAPNSGGVPVSPARALLPAATPRPVTAAVKPASAPLSLPPRLALPAPSVSRVTPVPTPPTRSVHSPVAAAVSALPDCVAFSPYIDPYNPNTGPHPTPRRSPAASSWRRPTPIRSCV